MQLPGAFTGRRIGAYVTVGVVVLGAAACNRGSDSGAEGNGNSKVRIAIVTRDFTNPYWAALRDGAIDQGKKLGVTVNVQAGENETDSTGENAKISTLAAQNYNCFGVVPVNATNVITPLTPVAQKKIPILDLDTQIDPKASKAAGVSYATFIGSDNLQAGRIAGGELAKKAKGGDVAILQGIAGEQNGINRQNGFMAATSGKLNVVAKQPADYDQAKGQTVAEGILRAHPGLKGIFAANDTMGLGAAKAVQNAGKKIPVVSVDGITAALKAVQAGQLDATVTQYPYAEGQMAVEACIRAVTKKRLPGRIVAPIALIDKADAAKALASFPKPFKPYSDPLAGTKAGG